VKFFPVSSAARRFSAKVRPVKPLTLADLASLLRLPPPSAEPGVLITGMATLTEASETEVSFLGHESYVEELLKTRAAVVLVRKGLKLPENHNKRTLVVDDPDLAQIAILSHFAPPTPRPAVGIDPSARLAATAVISENVAIGPNVVIGERTHLGRNTILHPGVVLGDDVLVGESCELFPNVVIRERITIGNRVTIHAGAVLGTDGFGYRWDGKQHVKVPQIGTVIIEDDVEIGSCVCIDRAKFSSTRIGRGTKIDNLVQVGHNCQVGPHCIIVGQAGLAGSATLGAGVVLGGQSAVRDHIRMGDGAMLAACSGVMEDVPARQVVSGLPALPHRQSLREQGAIRRLPELITQVRKLEERLARLESQAGKPPV
jgi:UDP-3-O-[3-hydroxymyristoyl] glucosamine N-acyltransferase